MSTRDKDMFLTRMTFAKGDYIMRQGEPGTHAFYIETGQVEVLVESSDRNEEQVSILGAGHIVGEMALIGDGQRTASVRALELVNLTSISQHDFQQKLGQSTPIFKAILEILVDRLKRTSAALAEKEQSRSTLEKTIGEWIDTQPKKMLEGERQRVLHDISPHLDAIKKAMAELEWDKN